jgi:hypothetical protein
MFQEHIASVFMLKDGGDMFPQNVGLSELRDTATQKAILFNSFSIYNQAYMFNCE